MSIPYRIGAWVITAACLTVILFMAASSEGLQNILYEDLTCGELRFSYTFNRDVLDDMVEYHDLCLDYVDSGLSGHKHGSLGCKFIREHGKFVEGIVNDIAGVYNIKCASK